jgi:non-ribosomal peptide synthase protein (TIGR01720 family)
MQLSVRQLFEHPTVAGLAKVAGVAGAVSAEQGPVTGEAPLIPIQHRFFEREIEARHHWNQAVLLRAREPLRADALSRSLARLAEHHDALRLRYTPRDGRWTQWFSPPGAEVPLAAYDISALAADERAAALEARAAEVHASMDLEHGPLFRAALFDLGGGGHRLLLSAHHLVVDGVSWRVLLEDLHALYAAEARGGTAALPPKTTSFREWAERLAEHAASPAMAREVEEWAAVAPFDLAPLPVDALGGENRVDAAARVSAALEPDETRALLHEVPAVYGTRINDVLLAALARTFAAWTGDGRLLVELEGHGREDLFGDVDLSRTVGWFTTVHPVLLDLRGETGARGALEAVKEQLRAVPGHGIGYGLLRYLSPDPAVRETMGALPPAGVSFNYLGQTDATLPPGSTFAVADEPLGPLTHPAGSRRPYLLEVVAIVRDGRLRCAWTYARDVHDEATVRRLADGFVDELKGLIGHCLSVGVEVEYAATDFALAGVDDDTLAMLEADLLMQDLADLDPGGG